MPSKRPKKTTFLAGIVLLVLLSFGLLGGAAFWAGTSLDARARSLATYLAEADRLGIKTEVDQLLVKVEPQHVDARPELEAAFKLWNELSESDRQQVRDASRAMVTGRPSRRTHRALERALEKLPLIRAHLDLAAMRAECSVSEPEFWLAKDDNAFAQFNRDAVRLYAAIAVAYGQRHDVESAETWLAKGTRLANHLSAQQSYVPILRQCAAELELQRALTRITFANSDSPAEMAALIRRQQERLGPLTSAADIMRGELALVLRELENTKRTGLDRVPMGEVFESAGKSGALEIWVRYFKQLPRDAENQNDAERVLIAMDKEADDTPFYGSYVNGYDRMMPLLRDVLARRRLAQMAAGLYEIRAGTGSISDLQTLTDPHNSEPIRLDESGEVIVLYSVGRDREDNRAKEREAGAPLSGHDILYQLPKTPTLE